MRVLFVNSVRTWGGGLSSALTLARGLAGAGHAVTLACNAHGHLRRRAEEHGLSVAPFRVGPDFDPFAAFALARIIRHTRPAVALADRRKDVKLLLLARAFGARTPIVHRHGAPSVLRDSFVYRAAWRRIDGIIVNSAAMRAALLRATPWLVETPIDVVHNAVDTDRFRPQPERRGAVRTLLGIPADAVVVAFHGVLQLRKRVDLLVRAAALLDPAERPVLLIIGDGPQRTSLEVLARSLDVTATFTGPRKDIPELLAAADAAAHLSRAEGFSNSVLEALACGLPVLATPEHSHPEQIDDGSTGILVPGNVHAVADALSLFAGDPDWRARATQAARDAAVTRFSIPPMVAGYERVLARHAGA